MDPAPQEEGPPTLLDLALLQGKPHELEALRRRVDEDPLTAIEFAETRALLERMLGASCEPAADWSVRLGQQLERAHARRRPRSEKSRRAARANHRADWRKRQTDPEVLPDAVRPDGKEFPR